MLLTVPWPGNQTNAGVGVYSLVPYIGPSYAGRGILNIGGFATVSGGGMFLFFSLCFVLCLYHLTIIYDWYP